MPDNKEEKGGCCSSGGGCGCCGGKAIKALILLLVGGVLGYLVGGHCAYMRKAMCPPAGMMMNTPTPAQK